jgi:hypothetical protein
MIDFALGVVLALFSAAPSAETIQHRAPDSIVRTRTAVRHSSQLAIRMSAGSQSSESNGYYCNRLKTNPCTISRATPTYSQLIARM